MIVPNSLRYSAPLHQQLELRTELAVATKLAVSLYPLSVNALLCSTLQNVWHDYFTDITPLTHTTRAHIFFCMWAIKTFSSAAVIADEECYHSNFLPLYLLFNGSVNLPEMTPLILHVFFLLFFLNLQGKFNWCHCTFKFMSKYQ